MKGFQKYRRRIFITVGALYFLTYLHRVSPTVIARDLASAFNADAVILGIISSSYFYLYAAVQPVVGFLCDTIGPRKVITTCSILAAAGAIMFGTAPNAFVATLGRALIGAGVGGVFIPSLKIFSRWYRVNEFASLTGIMIAIGGIGGLSAALPLTYLVLLLGWRASFVSLGIISCILAVSGWIIVRDNPEAKGFPVVVGGIYSPSQGGEAEAPVHTSFLKRLVMILGRFDFWMIALCSFFTGGVYLTFQGLWAVPYLMDVFGVGRVHAGWLLMVLPAGFAVGGLALGFFADRLNLNRKYLLLWALGLSALGWAALLFLQGRTQILIVCPVFLVFGLAAGGVLPIFYTIMRDLFPHWLMGTAAGLMNPAAFLGAALYQLFSGYLLSRFSCITPGVYTIDGYRYLLALFLISYIAAFVCAGLLSSQKRFLR